MLGMDEHDLFPLSPSLITGSLIFFPRRGWCRCCLLEAVTVMAGSDTMVMTNDPGWMHVPNTVRRRAIHCASPGVASRPFRNDPHPQLSTFVHLTISQSTCFVERRGIEIGG
jgi:hypothetical protein